MIGSIISAAFQFLLMPVAIDNIDWRGHNNEMGCKLKPKKTMAMLHYPFHITEKVFNPTYVTNKTECFVKHLKENWFTVLWLTNAHQSNFLLLYKFYC